MNTNITDFSEEDIENSDSIPENVEKFARLIADMIMVEMDARDEERERHKKARKSEQKRIKEDQKKRIKEDQKKRIKKGKKK